MENLSRGQTMNVIWLGTHAGYAELQLRLSALGNSLSAADVKLGPGEGLDRYGPNPLRSSVRGKVLVGEVRGPMLNNASWMTRYFGIATYDDIRSFLSDADANEDVNYAVLSYTTPGGAAKGCESCANDIRRFSESRKPVVSYVNEAASAGLWLSSAGSKVVADKEGETGSLGAITVHTETSKMRAQMGLTDTIMRTSPKKAIANSLEPLSEEAKAEQMSRLQRAHNSFVAGVAGLRGLSIETVESKIATGEMFWSDKAKRLGLVDSILPFNELVDRLSSSRPPKKGQKK